MTSARARHDLLEWRMLLGFVATYAAFEWTAGRLGSARGESGLLVGAMVVLATVLAAAWLWRMPIPAAVRRLGLGRPDPAGMRAALAICAALLLSVPAWLAATDDPLATYPGWERLLPGLFAQAGVAEEVLFRGYLFGHLRRGRTFLRAAVLACAPFVLVHLWLFWSLPAPIALTSVLLAAVIGFPLAYLFELGGGTIWAPAAVHWVVQSVPKLLTFGTEASPFPIVWIGLCAIVPFLAFAFERAPLGRQP